MGKKTLDEIINSRANEVVAAINYLLAGLIAKDSIIIDHENPDMCLTNIYYKEEDHNPYMPSEDNYYFMSDDISNVIIRRAI